MAQTSLRVYAKNFAMVSDNTPNTHVAVTVPGPNALSTNYAGGGNWMLFQFDDPTNRLGTYRLYDVRGVFNVGSSATSSWIKAILGSYDPNTVAWNTKPEISGIYGSLVGGEVFTSGRHDVTFSSIGTASAKTALAKELLKYCGGIFEPTGKSYLFELYTELLDASAPYLEFIYDDTETVPGKIVYKSGPTSGYANPREPIAFVWGFEKTGDYYCAADFTQTSAVFYWKESGAENYTAVNIQGEQQGVTIPANTFPTGTTIEWYVQGTEAGGATSQTEVYSFSTSAGTVTATPVSPVNTVESNNQPITFRWTYSSSDGYAPSRYKFLWKLITDSEWTTLLDETNVVTQYTSPANTFPAGEIQWTVVPYNIDGVQGTGQAASYICYGAPEAPAVYADSKPYTTVTWQASDQQAYQIKVDDTIYGPYFGTEKSFELPDYLEDGEHVIGVAVVGTYALWSDWGEITVTIQNVPGAVISLDAEAQIDVELMINTEEENPTFLIYRDDVLIAKTNQRTFVDRLALGEHTYKVVSKLTNGNYNISNEITRFSYVCSAHIAPLVGGEWLKINYTLKDQSDPEYEDSITTTYNHLSGSEFPSVSISEFRNKTVNYSAVFLFNQADKRKAFEGLYKKPVIMKFKDGTVFVGVLESMSKRPVKKYYTAYTFTLIRVDFEDYIDDTE